MKSAHHLFLLLSCIVCVRADYQCVCNYDVDNPVYLQPNNQSQKTGTLYEFDCKPLYEGYTGSSFVAIQIGGKVGYITSQSNIQQQICSGNPSSLDIEPTTTTSTTMVPITQPITTQTFASVTTKVQTSILTTQTRTAITTLPALMTTTLQNGPTVQSYHPSNVTGSLLQYIGIAYNLTNGNPVRGTGTPSLTDPGLLTGNQVFQVNEFVNGTPREVEVNHLTKTCSTIVSLIHNGRSYQEELLNLVRPTVKHPTQLTDAAFIFNKEFNQVRAYTESSNTASIYHDELTICSEQNLRLKNELADTEPLSITRDFAKDACDLPENYDVNEYIDFLDKWGTSIVTEVMLGTKQLQRFQTTIPTIFNSAFQKNQSLLHHAGSYMQYASSLSMSRRDYINTLAGSVVPGTNVHTYKTTGDLVPVSVKLEPITFAFDWRFWKDVLGHFHETRVCRDDVTMISLQRMAENIKRTLPQYFAAKNNVSGLNLSPLVDNNLQMPVTWPKGTYGLMKPTSGCPGAHVTWREGWRVQDSLSPNIHHHYSPSIGNTLAGHFSDKLETRYCMKTDSNVSPYDRDWPQGNYCILKKGNCPTGFSSGSIYWDDSDFINKNKHGGTLPDGTFNSNTKIYYCCRDDGTPANPITLPVDRPFLLFRYKGACQKVFKMNIREVYIEWDTADLFNKDEDQGAHPLDDGGDQHRLHFCYYYFNTGGVIVG